MDSCECYLASWSSSPRSHQPRKTAISPHGPQHHLRKSTCSPTLWTFVPFDDAESVSKVRTRPLVVPPGHKHLGEKWPIPLEPTLMFSASCWPFTGWIKYAESYFNSSLVSWTFDASHTRASQIICEKGYFFLNPACTSTFFKSKKKKLQKIKKEKKKVKQTQVPIFSTIFNRPKIILSSCYKCL